MMTSKWVAGVVGFAVIAVAGGVLASGFVLPGTLLFENAAKKATEVFDALPEELEIDQDELAQNSYIWAADGTLLATYYEENRVLVPLAEISQPMQDAIIALEDRRFWEHGGIDIAGMARAFVNNAAADGGDDGAMQGASTLTQQYVKNVLIERAAAADDPEEVRRATEASYSRKLREAKLAIALEEKIGKQAVLEGYLNIAQFGANIYGVEAAANYYFGKSAKDLSIVEAATIAAVTQRPNALDPSINPQTNEARRNDALSAMLKEGYITQAEYDAAQVLSVESTLDIHAPKAGCILANKKAGSGFFCDYVVSVIRNSPEFGETPNERVKLLKRGGLNIYTTLKLKNQKMALAAVEETVPKKDPTGVAMALSSVEPGTGKIIAMVQNRDYAAGTSTKNRQTAVNYNTDQNSGGSTGFQAGSTFKPFVLAEWLNEGHSLSERFPSSRTEYSQSAWKAKGCVDGDVLTIGPWKVSNSTGNFSSADAYLATQNSVNTAYVAMEFKLDLCAITEQLEKMGMHRADLTEWQTIPSMVLGSNEVAPLTMAAGYATFAAGGIYCKPVAITKVIDSRGKKLKIPEADCKRAMKADVAAGVAAAMSRVMTNGTGSAVAINDGRPQAGKTGTTDGNIAVWFGGFTPQVATMVWAGYSEGSKPLRNMLIGGVWFTHAYGGALPGRAWDKFMTAYLEGKEQIPFPEVSDAIGRGTTYEVPSVVGMTLDAAKAKANLDGFDVVADGDGEYSDSVPKGQIITQSPGGGAEIYLTGGATITVYISKGPDPDEDDDDSPKLGGDSKKPTSKSDTKKSTSNSRGENDSNRRETATPKPVVPEPVATPVEPPVDAPPVDPNAPPVDPNAPVASAG